MAPPTGAPASISDIPALRAPCWRNAGLAFGVVRCAFATLVAGLRYPTIRRSFVVAREVLCAAGREDLADELLRLLGSFALSRAEVETLAAEAERTYDVAVDVRRTPVVMDWNVSRDARELERAAVRELIDAGHHREALFQLLLVRTAAQGITENDGAEEARTSSRIGYRQLLAALGIDGDESFQARGQALRAFMPALREGCEALLARAPGSTLGDGAVVTDRAGNFYYSTAAGFASLPNPGVDTEHNWVRYGVAISRSTDHGDTFSTPQFVALDNGMDKPWMAIGPDPAVPSRDNIYLAWNSYNSSGSTLVFSGSTDGGTTWSPPKTIFSYTDDGLLSSYVQWGNVTVDKSNGRIMCPSCISATLTRTCCECWFPMMGETRSTPWPSTSGARQIRMSSLSFEPVLTLTAVRETIG